MFWAPQAVTVHLRILRLAENCTSWGCWVLGMRASSGCCRPQLEGRDCMQLPDQNPGWAYCPWPKVYSAGQGSGFVFFPCFGIWGWVVSWLKSEFLLSFTLQGFWDSIKVFRTDKLWHQPGHLPVFTSCMLVSNPEWVFYHFFHTAIQKQANQDNWL